MEPKECTQSRYRTPMKRNDFNVPRLSCAYSGTESSYKSLDFFPDILEQTVILIQRIKQYISANGMPDRSTKFRQIFFSATFRVKKNPIHLFRVTYSKGLLCDSVLTKETIIYSKRTITMNSFKICHSLVHRFTEGNDFKANIEMDLNFEITSRLNNSLSVGAKMLQIDIYPLKRHGDRQRLRHSVDQDIGV